MFIAREKEKELLKGKLTRGKKASILLYGRRRIGKTSLVCEVLEEIQDAVIISHEFHKVALEINLEEFSNSVGLAFGIRSMPAFRTIVDAFTFIAAQNRRTIVVLDEYSDLKEGAMNGARVKSDLMMRDDVVVLNKAVPSTKFCPHCGKLNSLSLKDRVYHCDCGAEDMDRDVHAARNMIWFYENNVGVGRTETSAPEIRRAIEKAFIKGNLGCHGPLMGEASTFLGGSSSPEKHRQGGPFLRMRISLSDS